MRSSLLGMQAHKCLTELRAAVTGVLQALPGELEQPRDVYKTLGIDRMIGWNIYKFHELNDCFLSVKHIPRKAAFKGFLRASAKKGVSESLLTEAENCFMEFEKLVALHAGDRPSMEMMLQAYSEEGCAQASIDHRKLAFTGNRFLYGLESKTRLTITLFEPGSSPDSWKLVILKGSFGLRRNRPDIPWFYMKPKVFTESSAQPKSLSSTALVSGVSGDLPYYPQFCNCSLPGLKSRSTFVDSIEEIFPEQTGNAGLMDLVFAEVVEMNNFSLQNNASTSSKVITPCQTVANDIILPTSAAEALIFTPRVISSILEETDSFDENVIDIAQSILPVTPDFSISLTQNTYAPDDVPGYHDIISDIFKRRDLNPLNYTTVRISIPFPVIPSTLDIAWTPSDK
ncbi:hypothetical protein CSA37_07635 [Candidatus Fermentibacteria bacterium]|nr:MAG: hypothetical protein CSA37_07635 [Candidatus Fermentibacteria bacterium]